MDSSVAEQDRAWIDGEIIYWTFANRPDFAAVRALQDQSLATLMEKKIELAPLIFVYGAGTEHQRVRLGLFEIGKVVNHPLSKHLTEVWMVYKGDIASRAFVATINRFYVQGRFHLVDTLEQAQAEAKQSLVKKISITEDKSED
jgi:hypothetical protein